MQIPDRDLISPALRVFDQDAWYTIRVEIQGNRISTYVDSIFLAEATLPTPLVNTQGGIGFGFDGGEKINFDDIKVWSLK